MASVLLAIALAFSFKAMGLGLVVPGPETEQNYLYQVEGDKLYRYVCEDGIVPTKDSCPKKDPTFLISHSNVRRAVEKELETELKTITDEVSAEISALKEADPTVKAKRDAIRAGLKGIKVVRGQIADLETKNGILTKSEANVATELENITARLEKELSQAELLRLTEVFGERLSQQAELTVQKSQIARDIAALRIKLAGHTKDVTTNSVELGKLLPTLVVQSARLVDLQGRKTIVEGEQALLPELDKRLTDPLAYPLDVWAASGSPCVEPLTDRFLKRASALCRGEVIGRPGLQ